MSAALKRLVAAGAAIVVIAVAACVDMSAPKGPASISLLQLPALYVVRGDSMRDTNGVAMAPTLLSFDASGTGTPAPNAQFFITDSLTDTIPARFGANGVLLGLRNGIVHLVGQLGNLQTPPIAVPVTSAPDTIVKPAADTTLGVPVGADSASSIGSVVLGVVVRGGVTRDTLIQGVVVTFAITPLPSIARYPATYLTDGSLLSLVDTTDQSGTASRTLVVNSSALDSHAFASFLDTVVVTATAKYKGVPIPGAPIVFRIPVGPSFK